jgi:hypothetical protein
MTAFHGQNAVAPTLSVVSVVITVIEAELKSSVIV